MYIKDGKVGSNHSDQSQVCQLHCFVTTKPNAPHMRGTPLKLMQAHLATTGNKADLVERLLQHEASYVQGSSGLPARSGGSESTVSDSTDGTDDADQDETTSRYSLAASNLAIGTPTPDGSSETSEDSLGDQTACEDVAPPHGTRRKHQRPQRPAVSRARRTLHCSPAGAARISRMHSVTAHGKAHSPDDSAISTEPATSKGARQHPSKSKSPARKRRRRRSMSSASSSTSSSLDSSSSSGSSSSESSDSDARRKKRKSKSKRHKRHHHSKSRDRSSLNAPFTTMVPTPSRREAKRIKKGKYAHFDKLLSPIDDPFSLPVGKRKGKDRRQVCDLGSWFEAWNIFIAIRVQIAPNTALELLP